MHKNDVGKFFTSFWPDFLLREIVWLFIIAFSITLFNMLPLPVFDGDRIVKELINWGIGEDYKTIKEKTDRFLFKKNEKELPLREYRVENVDNIKIFIKDPSTLKKQSSIVLSEENYQLVDKIGDGFKDTITLNLPEQTKLEEGAYIEVSYNYWHDEKRKLKSNIINSIRFITLFLVLGTIILSLVKFGRILFYV